MAGIGPFDSFSFPDVYTKTLNEPPRPTAAGSLRFPAFIGIANETIPYDNVEMIRGSSSMADNKITRENVSSQFNGTNRNFTVTYYPIVSGDGSGTVTTDVSKVIVYINGDPVPVASVNGTTGEIYLVNIPSVGDEVLCTYYFKKLDTYHLNEDLSDQIDGVTTSFRVHEYPIVSGNNGGSVTTDPTKVIAKVNGSSVTVSAVDGGNGLITLVTAPTPGQTLTVTYYSNELQDTADILPSPYVADIRKVGYAPGTTDFIENTDYVLDSTGAFYTIQWGASYKISSGSHTIGTTYFDSSSFTFQQMYDNRIYRRLTTGTPDGTRTEFTLEAPPMTGEGRGVTTENPAKLGPDSSTSVAFYGTSPTDATAIKIIAVEPNNIIKLASAPPAGTRVYATQYTNLLIDDTWTYTNTVAGGAGDGTYQVSGANTGAAMNVSWSLADSSVADPAFAGGQATYPLGVGPNFSDAQVVPGYAVAETVKLTFQGGTDSTQYIVTSNNAIGTGSSGDNTGYLNQTYVDRRTGFRITVMQHGWLTGTVVYQGGDYIGYTVSPSITASASPSLAVLGMKLAVTSTTGIGTGDTAVVNTYNRSGSEPNIGDFYYVSFDENKQFSSEGLTEARLYTQEKDVIADTGSITINNRVGLASHLAFLNGAAALAILQIQRSTGGTDAPDSRYIAGIDYFNEPMPGGYRPVLMQPVTTSTPVITYLKNSNTIQSGIRYANERMSYFGFPVNTSPTTAQTFARAMLSERMIGVYPDGAITTITDSQGNDVEYLVDGSLMAAALAGRDVSPAFDVAEPITRKPIVGFSRLFRRMDSVTSAQTANAGLTLIEEQAGNMIIKFGLTTDLSSVLTRTPSVVKIKDFVQKGSRSVLQPYIGQKFLTTRTGEIESTLKAYLAALQQGQIITSFTGVKATVDPNDATIVNVEAYYSPVLPLLWIVITFNLRSGT